MKATILTILAGLAMLFIFLLAGDDDPTGCKQSGDKIVIKKSTVVECRAHKFYFTRDIYEGEAVDAKMIRGVDGETYASSTMVPCNHKWKFNYCDEKYFKVMGLREDSSEQIKLGEGKLK